MMTVLRSYVYVIGVVDGCVKVGASWSPKKRLNDMQSDSQPTTLERRRFEVRYAEDGSDDGPWLVLGWHDTREGAERMAASWRKRPSTTSAWVVDTEIPHGGNYAETP